MRRRRRQIALASSYTKLSCPMFQDFPDLNTGLRSHIMDYVKLM